MSRLATANVLALIGIVCVAAVPSAHAGSIDMLTLTPDGTNTDFAITGTFPPNAPTTPFSSPDEVYSLTFTLPTTPSSLAFVDTVDGIFGIDTTVTVNSVTFPNSQIAFFVAAQAGGLDVCLSEGCSPDPPTLYDRWVVLGDQLFSGTVSNPVFNSGAANIDQSQSFIEAPVPEPATLALTGIALAALAFRRQKRYL